MFFGERRFWAPFLFVVLLQNIWVKLSLAIMQSRVYDVRALFSVAMEVNVDKRKQKDRRISRDGKTVGISLRVEAQVLAVYANLAAKANSIDVAHGGRGGKTAQDVMRHQLYSLPAVLGVREGVTQ